jgi:ribulose-5-phosphate 4-epimerase/fuculose-1-phosphate aldolase
MATSTIIATQTASDIPAVEFTNLQATDPNATSASQGGIQVQLQKIPSPPMFKDKFEEREYLKGRLALAFRIFGKFGFDEGVAGHITLRDPVKTDHFWVNPLGNAFSLMKRSDLILVDKDGNVVDGGANRLLNRAAYMIHHAVHTARPDVNCAAHSHSLYGRSFCSLGRTIDMLTQDACAFYEDLALYNQFKGVVLAEEEGINIANAIGPKKACLLQNHGILTVGQTVEAAVFWFTSLEKCCKAQLLAEAAAAGVGSGKPIQIDQEDAEFTYKSVGTDRVGWFSAKPLFDVMISEIGDEYLQ